MKKFKYRMENILNIKYRLEDQAKADFAENAKKLRDEEIKLKSIYDDIYEYEKKLREMSSSALNINDLKWARNAIEIKKEHVKKQKMLIKIAKKNLEITRKKLNDAILERKTHENLKEKQFEIFVEGYNKEELKEIDEVVNYKYSSAGR